jgi:hypothetical protein
MKVNKKKNVQFRIHNNLYFNQLNNLLIYELLTSVNLQQ